MARPAQVEFPGQKRNRMRMRGTKQANLETQKRLRKNLDRLLEEGETLLPAMTWNGKLKWRLGIPTGILGFTSLLKKKLFFAKE